jgi:hypothetical protein
VWFAEHSFAGNCRTTPAHSRRPVAVNAHVRLLRYPNRIRDAQ